MAVEMSDDEIQLQAVAEYTVDQRGGKCPVGAAERRLLEHIVQEGVGMAVAGFKCLKESECEFSG